MHWSWECFGLGAVQAMGYWTTTSVWCSACFRPMTSAQPKCVAINRVPFQRWLYIDCEFSRGCSVSRYCRFILVPASSLQPGQYSVQRGVSAHAALFTAGPACWGLGITALVPRVIYGLSFVQWCSAFATVWTLLHLSSISSARKTRRSAYFSRAHGGPFDQLICNI